MIRIPVSSSNLASVGYDSRSAMLEIEFIAGGTYQYTGVPQAVHDGLKQAASHGKYFHARIKGRYPFTKVR